MKEGIATWNSFIEGPRWAGASKVIKNLAWMLGLELDMEVDNGWIRETIRFKVSGPLSKVENFRDSIVNAVENYNS